MELYQQTNKYRTQTYYKNENNACNMFVVNKYCVVCVHANTKIKLETNKKEHVDTLNAREHVCKTYSDASMHAQMCNKSVLKHQ